MTLSSGGGFCCYVLLRDIPTKIMVFGERAPPGSVLPEDHVFDHERLVVFFSGFLGEIEYYWQFLSEIHQRTGLPLIGLSNSGHNRIPGHLAKPEIKSKPWLFSLAGQIQHKVLFLRRHIHPQSRLVLIGHSAACHIILQIMRHCPEVNDMIQHCILLFPVIDRLRETNEARLLRHLTAILYRPALFLSRHLDRWLSAATKERLIVQYMALRENRRALPPWVRRAATNLFDPYCLMALRAMALDQLRSIRKPPLEVMRRNARKLTLMYAEQDRWVPLDYYQWLRDQLADCPEIDIRLNLGHIDHSLVVDADEALQAARITAKAVLSKLQEEVDLVEKK